MIFNKLGKTDLLVSKIALGTAQFGLDYGFSQIKSQEQVDQILKVAQENNVTLIDTAREYGDSESKIGKFLSNYKNNFIIATKLKKFSFNDINKSSVGFSNIIFESIEQSLLNLNLAKLDILQLHQTDEFILQNTQFWNTIKWLKDKNIIKAFGVSIYELKDAFYLVENFHHLIDFFQVPYNIFDRRFEMIFDLINSKSISILSRSTFLKGIITTQVNKLPVELNGLKKPKLQLQKKAKSLNMSVSDLATLFVYCSSFVSSFLVGVDTATELDINIKVTKGDNCNLISKTRLRDLMVKDNFLIDPRKWNFF
jgi:aryl-alcohol dehydrogenase-like predicted oxidoreductase